MWPFRRRSADASPPGDDADGGEVLRPARAEWRSVEPLRPVQTAPLATIDRGFEQSLTTRARPLFIESLSHHVHPSAPAGTVDGLAVPSSGVADGVVRTFAAPAATAQRITSADEPTPPAVQRSPAATPAAPPAPTSTPTSTSTPAAPPAVDERAPDAAPRPANEVVSIDDPDPEPSPPVAAIVSTDDLGPADEVAERPLLNERAPIATPLGDDAPTTDPAPPVAAPAPAVEPVQRRIELGAPSPARPTMRIGAPLPPSTDRALVGQRETSTDDGPVTSVAREAPSVPVPGRPAVPRLGAPLDPGLTIQRSPADHPVPAALDDAVPAGLPSDDVATVPTVPSGPADRPPVDDPTAPTADAPLVGGDPIRPSTAPERPAIEPSPSPSPSPSLSPAGLPNVAGSPSPAVQRTVFDTPTSPAATPRLSRAIEPAAITGTSVAADHAATDPPASALPTAEAPLVGSAEPLVELALTAAAGDTSPAASGPLVATSDPATAAGIVTAWGDDPAVAPTRPIDGGLLGDRPPTLTVDWADRAAPAGDTAPSPSGRAEVGAPSTPPVVSRTLADRSSRPPAAMVGGAPDTTRAAPAVASGRPPVLQFGPPPTPIAPLLSFDAAPTDVAAAPVEATSFELPAAVQRQLLGEPATGPAPVAVQTESVAAAPSTAVAAATGGATPGRSDAEIVELARVLYPQLQRRLARDLLLDRERAGYRTDIRF